MWDDLINENTLITFLVGMYFWGWFLFLRSKFSKKNNWFHVIFFLIFLEILISKIFFNSKKISGFLSKDIQYLKHCIKWLKKEKYYPDLIVLLRPTTPFREVKVIDKAIKLIIKTN